MPVDDESTQGYQGNMQTLKQNVLAQYQDNRMYKGQRVLHEASQEIWVYNPQGQWRVSTLRTRANQDAPPSVEAVLERPLGALERATRLDKDLVLPEALELREDKMCTIRQMSVVLGLPEENLMKAFDEIQPGWPDKGIKASSILTYAQEKNITTTVLYADNVVGRHKPSDRKHCKAMTFAIEGNHALFYKNPRVMLKRAPAKRRLRNEKAVQPVQWVPFEGLLQDGTF